MAQDAPTLTAGAQAWSLPTMKYEEFLRCDSGGEQVEWVNGKVVPMSPVSREHADVSLFLLRLIAEYAEAKALGRVFFEPFQMKTGPNLPGRAPGIFFVANKNLSRLKRLYLDGPADLVVEVTSPGSRGLDRGDKYFEYEQGGVPEFWLIDPHRKQAEFYLRGADGISRPAAVGAEGVFRSTALADLWIKVEWLWQEPLPAVSSVLGEWGLTRPRT